MIPFFPKPINSTLIEYCFKLNLSFENIEHDEKAWNKKKSGNVRIGNKRSSIDYYAQIAKTKDSNLNKLETTIMETGSLNKPSSLSQENRKNFRWRSRIIIIIIICEVARIGLFENYYMVLEIK